MKNIPVVIIIFGGSGDLAHRKLYPALFNLYEQGLIHDHFAVIGTARRPWSNDFLRSRVKEVVNETHSQVDEKKLTHFASHFYYQSHDVTNVNHYVTLKKLAQDLDQRYQAKGNRIFYMAMAPRFFGTIATHINDQHLVGPGFNRIVVEKPFGRDLASAKKLNSQITAAFKENEIFRIDHYLGKEMVQNILPLRFGNSLISDIWNSKYIQNMQVTLSERLGVEARGGYYDHSGALRDMVQNHIFQIITLLAMPRPKDLSSEAIHEAKQNLLRGLIIPSEEEVKQHFVRGQYANTDNSFAYRREPKVDPHSMTETFAAGRVRFKTGPVAGVPIYFRTGKEMKEKKSRIDVVFKPNASLYGAVHSNSLTIEIDPRHQIYLSINGKKIREKGIRRERLAYRFSHDEMQQVPDGYERLLHDVLVSDSTNFTHWSELERYWQFIDAVEETWAKQNKSADPEISQYVPYLMGPNTSKIFTAENEHWIYE